MKKTIILASAAAMLLVPATASAQAQQTRQDPISAIFGALFGDRAGVTTSIESQWAAGQTPLANQRAQFDARVDSEVSTGAINRATGARLKTDYAALVQLESRYGADRRFTTAERSDLADRYGALTQVLVDRGYADGATTTEVADGRAAFDARVDAAVSARRITRSQGNRLKRDYAAVAQLETSYLGDDGVLSQAEIAELDERLDALDVRLGDTGYAVAMTPRARLDAVARALPSVGLSSASLAQLRTEHEDLSRLESAYARLAVTADERAYLDRRLTELETRARLR